MFQVSPSLKEPTLHPKGGIRDCGDHVGKIPECIVQVMEEHLWMDAKNLEPYTFTSLCQRLCVGVLLTLPASNRKVLQPEGPECEF